MVMIRGMLMITARISPQRNNLRKQERDPVFFMGAILPYGEDMGFGSKEKPDV